MFFQEYDLLARSGLFDAAYYLSAYPDVAARNIDPLLHYIEEGARQGLNPGPDFDSGFYLEQCRRNGETPANPLAHYLKVGSIRGYRPSSSAPEVKRAAKLSPTKLHVDRAALTELPGGQLRLNVEGWVLAPETVTEISVLRGDQQVAVATIGLVRPDLAATHPEHPDAANAGFAIHAEFPADSQARELGFTLIVVLAGGRAYRQTLALRIEAMAARLQAKSPARSPGLRRDQRPPMRIKIDEATVDHNGVLNLSGWAVCLVKFATIEAWIGEECLGAAKYGHTREDVGAQYKDYPNASQSGFQFFADVRRLGAGQHILRVTAKSLTGVLREETIEVVVPDSIAAVEASLIEQSCDEASLSTLGDVFIKGWAVCGAPTRSIEVFVDGESVGFAELGELRPDVGSVFPLKAYAQNAGFRFGKRVSSSFEVGERLLGLRVTDILGAFVEIPLPVLVHKAVAADALLPGNSEAVPAAAEAASPIVISIDSPKLVNGVADAPVSTSLSINGWAMARAGIAGIEILIDGQSAGTAQSNIRRDDVAGAFPDREDALHSGFATLIPHWLLTKGQHTVSVRVMDRAEGSAIVDFRIEVEDIPEGEGPWSLRPRMAQSEADLHFSVLAGLGWQPAFNLLLQVTSDKNGLAQARKTLASLRAQIYPDWVVLIVGRQGKPLPKAWASALLAGNEELRDRIVFCKPRVEPVFASQGTPQGDGGHQLIGFLCGGDVLGCDALLEFALASGHAPDSDCFYADERRISPVTGKPDAYFKPGWSPDLQLASNYVGRPLCIRAALYGKAAISVADWLEHGHYDLALRATDAARNVHHVAKVLCVRGVDFDDTGALEKRALERAVKRRRQPCKIETGLVPRTFRLRRTRKDFGLVSIIIPTRATRGLVKTCIESLREKTAYKNIEIICIQNIPLERAHWKTWLELRVEKVLETAEPFNWSRYNNLCAEHAKGDYLLFLNDDIEVIEPDWLDTMLAEVVRPEVGVVGPLLIYPDRSVQHAGLALTDVMGRARHLFRHGREDDPGYFGLALTQRNTIAVTGACMLMRRETYQALGRFEEAYNVINNDLDLCLKSWRNGLLNVYTPHAKLIHHEMVSRAKLGDAFDSKIFIREWSDVFTEGDPYLNRNLSRQYDNLTPEREPVLSITTGHPRYRREAIHRILVVKLDHIGDCITALPAIRRLKAAFPAAEISLLSATATKLVWSMEAVVSRVLEFNFFHARSQLGVVEITEDDLEGLGQFLQPLCFDLAIDLRKSPDTRRVLQFTGAKYLAGFDSQARFPWLDITLEWEKDFRLVSKRRHVSDDLINLVDAVAAAGEPDRRLIVRKPGPPPSLSEQDSAGLFDRSLVCMHAGAGNEMKEWPAESFGRLANLLIDREGVNVAMIGGPDEVALSDRVIGHVKDASRIRNLAGRLKLNELPDLLMRASLFVGNDSGPKHIAAALGIPTIGVHSGNIDPVEWGPMGPKAVAMHRQTSCSPCYLDRAASCPRELACIKGIGAGDAFRLSQHLLRTAAMPAKACARTSDL